MHAPVVPEAGVLRAALPGDEEQGGERGEDQEPVREVHLRDDTAGHGPEHEARRDHGQLHHGLSLEPNAVGDAQSGIGRHDDGEAPRADEERAGDGHRDEACPGAQGEPGPQGATGHGPEPLDRVVPIGLGVDHVVDEVGARGHDAEHEEGARSRGRAVCQSPSTPAAAGAMNTSRFLIHCRGRIPRAISPRLERAPDRGEVE